MHLDVFVKVVTIRKIYLQPLIFTRTRKTYKQTRAVNPHFQTIVCSFASYQFGYRHYKARCKIESCFCSAVRLSG